jgi:hypothetical protein
LKHYAEVKADNEKQKYDLWIENEGIMLGNKVYNKAQLSEQLSAKVGIVICFINCITTCNAYVYLFFNSRLIEILMLSQILLKDRC